MPDTDYAQVLDEEADLSLGSANGGKTAPILDVIRFSGPQQAARADVKRERSHMAQKWKQEDEPPKPTQILSEKDFVRKHMPKVLGMQTISRAQRNFIREQYNTYVARTRWQDNFSLARWRATPSPLRETETAALEDLLEEYDGDPVKALQEFKQIGGAKDANYRLDAQNKLYEEAMRKYPNDPRKAWMYAQGQDPDAEPEINLDQLTDKALLEQSGGDPVKATEEKKKLGKEESKPTLSEQADDAFLEKAGGDPAKAWEMKGEAGRAKPTDKGLMSSGFISDALYGEYAEDKQGLVQRVQSADPTEKLEAFGELVDFASTAQSQGVAEKEMAKIQSLVDKFRPSAGDLKKMYDEGVFHDPEFQKYVGVQPYGMLQSGNWSKAGGDKKAREALQAYMGKIYPREVQEQMLREGK